MGQGNPNTHRLAGRNISYREGVMEREVSLLLSMGAQRERQRDERRQKSAQHGGFLSEASESYGETTNGRLGRTRFK